MHQRISFQVHVFQLSVCRYFEVWVLNHGRQNRKHLGGVHRGFQHRWKKKTSGLEFLFHARELVLEFALVNHCEQAAIAAKNTKGEKTDQQQLHKYKFYWGELKVQIAHKFSRAYFMLSINW